MSTRTFAITASRSLEMLTNDSSGQGKHGGMGQQRMDEDPDAHLAV